MRRTINGQEAELGFQLRRALSRRYTPTILTDLDFADDLALISSEIDQAQEFLSRLETEANQVGLHLNAKKTEVMAFGQDRAPNIQSSSNNTLKVVDNFKYLGGWMQSSEKDISVRKALAWTACHKLKQIWSSSLNRNIKIRLFLATVESVLLYGSETWTLTKTLEKQLNGTYTRLLRMATNTSWNLRLTNNSTRSCPSCHQKLHKGDLDWLVTVSATKKKLLTNLYCGNRPRAEQIEDVDLLTTLTT